MGGFQGGVKKAVAYEKKYLINAKTLAKDASTDFETYAKQVEAEQKQGAKVISLEQAKPVANQVAAAVKKVVATAKKAAKKNMKQAKPVVKKITAAFKKAQATAKKDAKKVKAFVKKDEVAAAKGFQGGVKQAVAYEKKYLINAKTLAKDAETDFATYMKQFEAEQKQGAKVNSLEQAKSVVKQVTAAVKKVVATANKAAKKNMKVAEKDAKKVKAVVKKAQATAKKDAKKVKAVVKKDEVAAAKGFPGGVKKAVAYEKKYLINAKTLAKDAETDFETYAKQVEAEQKKGAKVISLEQAKQ